MKMPDPPLMKKLRHMAEQYDFYKPAEKTLVGFSGGADSMALLHGLLSLLGRERVVALHVNHMLRGEEAQRDEAFCRAFCHANDILFVSEKVNVSALGEHAVEENARKLRYEALEKTAARFGCTTISLAHHGEDNLETMLFHMVRGTGLRGLSGIPPMRPLGGFAVVRPLLDCTKAEILAYLEENSLSYVTDSTNFDTNYTRNFIRQEILPKLYEIAPKASENARMTADIARDAALHLESEAERFLSSYGDGIPAETLRALSPALRHEVFLRCYAKVGGDTLSPAKIDAVDALILFEKTNKEVALRGDITVRLDGKMLRFLKKNEEKNTEIEGKYPLKEGENRLPNGILLVISCPSADLFTMKNEEILFMSCTEIPKSSLPSLHLRPREKGESYRFGKMTRSLKKLLSGADHKTKSRPLICDERGILWHPNFKVRDHEESETVSLLYLETAPKKEHS